MTLLYDWLNEAAKAQGNSKALVYRDNYLSWRGLLHRVDRRAQEFKAMGIKEGVWVGLMLGNVPDFVILALALSKLDATIIPIDPTTGTRELELILAAAPLKALVTRPRGSEGGITATGTPAPAKPRNGRAPTQDDDEEPKNPDEVPEVRRRLQGTLLTCSVFKRPEPEVPVTPLAVLFTADSLGDPKGVLRTGENMTSVVDEVIRALEIEPQSRVLTAVPLFHAYGWDIGLLPVLKAGATMYLEEESSARRIGKVLREHAVDVFPGTPPMYAELSRLPTAKPLKLDKPRFLSSGSKLEPEVADSFSEKYETKLISCYHSTEAGMIALDLSTKAPKSVGKPVAGIELRITDTDGGKQSIGKEGLIWVRGGSISAHSIGPFADARGIAAKPGLVGIGEMDDEGWYRTGDLGKFDRGGKLYLTGREDDVVKVDGKRVALGEVEGCLESFPKVKAAQARVITDPLTGSMVVARVVTESNCQAEEIIDHCARNLAPYKVPRRIEFCDQI